MHALIPMTIAAALLLPTAALACPNCILHGTEREDKTWTKFVGRKNPALPAPATASAKVSNAAKAPAPPVKAKSTSSK